MTAEAAKAVSGMIAVTLLVGLNILLAYLIQRRYSKDKNP